MTRITNNLELVRLVQQQLSNTVKAKRKRLSKPRQNNVAGELEQLGGLQKITSIEGYSEEDVRRALVQSLLTEEFGDRLINDNQFQQLVDQVTRIVSEDGDADAMTKRVLKDLQIKK